MRSFAITVVLALVILRVAHGAAPSQVGGMPETAELKVILPDVARAEVVPDPTGDRFTFRVEYKDGRTDELTADEFAAMSYRSQTGRPWWQLVLNVSSPIGIAWVALGLLGQVLFTGRMLVQWIASEREHESVVPVAFWWMSLGGASMLLVYFVWRKDIVGVLGQATGWLIYGRNLWLIHRKGVPQPT